MTEPSAIRTELDWAFAGRRRARRLRQAIAAAVSIALFAAALLYRLTHPASVPPRYRTAAVSIGDIFDRVHANGTLEPTLQVKVSAQASGRVASVFVDFNSEVTKGDVLAEIDQSIAVTNVEERKANLQAQAAQLERANADAASNRLALDRVQRMFDGAAATRMELDNARAGYDMARAAVAAAEASVAALRAQVSLAQTSVTHTKVLSPVDGVVIARNVDPGASVVASFQAETLFVIARDLRSMRIVADVDEADVSKLKQDMPVQARVDAYPSDTFHGTLRQIRYASRNQQGVVTYPAVIELSNDEGKLRPGMSATVTFDARVARGVTRVANAALRFRPRHATDDAPTPEPEAGQGALWLLAADRPGNERIAPVSVRLGITDGTNTEIVGGPLDSRSKVVVDELEREP